MHLVESIRERVWLSRAPEVQTIFQQHIARNAVVVVGGPGESPRYDSGLLWAAYWVAPGGSVCIADPQSTGDDPTRSESYDRKYILGTGDVAEYQTYLNVMKEAGLPLSSVTWLGRQSTLWHMPELSDGMVDNVMDHYTSVFLLRVLALPTKETRNLWGRILAEYRRVLRPGGTLLLQSHMAPAHVDGVFASHEELMRQMRDAGFRVSHLLVRDGLRVPLSDDVFARLKKPENFFGSDAAKKAATLAAYVRNIHGVPTITPPPFYPSPDVYIAQKV